MTINNALLEAKVAGFCLYEIYGEHDLLVRAWMNYEQFQKFDNSLTEERSVVRKDVFTTSNIDYLWSKKYLNNPHIENNLVHRFTPDQYRSVQGEEPNDELLAKFSEQNLILKDEPLTIFENIKFYMSLNYSAGVVRDKALQDLKTYLLRADTVPETIQELTIYTGQGANSDFWLKGVTKDQGLYDITEMAIKLLSQFKSLGMQSSTLIVASQRNQESDNLSFYHIDFTYRTKIAISELGLDEELVEDLDKFALRELQDKFEDLKEKDILPTHKELVKPFFDGYIKQDASTFMGRLLVELVNCEDLLRTFTFLNLEKKYGTHWQKTDFERLKKAVDIDEGISAGKLTMQDYISLLGKIKAERGLIVDEMPDGWIGILRTARTLRNNLVHSRFDEEAWLSMWGDVIDFLAGYIPIQTVISNSFSENR